MIFSADFYHLHPLISLDSKYCSPSISTRSQIPGNRFVVAGDWWSKKGIRKINEIAPIHAGFRQKAEKSCQDIKQINLIPFHNQNIPNQNNFNLLNSY